MSEIEEIKVLWEGPFKLDQILDNKIDHKDYDVNADDIGLYMIYGSHPLYGDGSLVYIGRTLDEKGFRSRLKNRWVIENNADAESVEIYLGTIFSDERKLTKEEVIDKELIEKSEVLLINALKPAFNSSNIQSAYEDYVDSRYLIHNEGNYRKLPAVLDSKYFWQEYKNHIIVEKCLKDRVKLEKNDDYYGAELNELYDINDDYLIWFGVDYEIWTREKIPYMFQVYSKDKSIIKKLKKSKEFKYYEYKGTDEYLDIFYLEESLVDIVENFDDKVKELIFTVEEVLKK